jgi:uridine kinase
VDGLTGDSQGVADLLPRPALRSRRRDVLRFDPLSQTMQRQGGTKPERRIARRETFVEFVDVHDCQYRLTTDVCQSILTPEDEWGCVVLDEIVGLIRATPRCAPMGPKVVVIDGGAGSGKSTLARLLSRELDGAPIVQTDDFASWDNPFGWAPRFMEQVLLPLTRGQPVRYQRRDWEGGQLTEWIDVPTMSHLIIDGVSSLRVAFTPYITFSIWVETPRDERLRRGLERDGGHMEERWIQWMSDEEDYVRRESPALRADVIIQGDRPLD